MAEQNFFFCISALKSNKNNHYFLLEKKQKKWSQKPIAPAQKKLLTVLSKSCLAGRRRSGSEHISVKLTPSGEFWQDKKQSKIQSFPEQNKNSCGKQRGWWFIS